MIIVVVLALLAVAVALFVAEPQARPQVAVVVELRQYYLLRFQRHDSGGFICRRNVSCCR